MALLACGSSKPAREQLHRSEIEPDLTAGDGGLKVLGEAAVAVEPSEGSFDHPAARQDTRAGTIGPFDDLDSPPGVSGQCRGQLIAGIAAIGKDMVQPREQIADRRQQARCHRALAGRPPASPIASSMDEIRIPCRAEVGLRRRAAASARSHVRPELPRSGHSPMAGQTVQSFGYADTKARCSGFEEPRVHSAGGVDEQEGIRPARHFNFARPMTFRPCGDRTLPADRVRNTRCRTSAIA